MKKISLNDFKKVMSYDVLKDNTCIEIEFYVKGSSEYNSCWLGKMPSEEKDSTVYWFGLTRDGTQAYDFSTLEEFISAKVFGGKCIKDTWDMIYIQSIDGCDVEERIPFYLGLEEGPIRGAAIPLNKL